MNKTAEDIIKKYKIYIDNFRKYLEDTKPQTFAVEIIKKQIKDYEEVINDLTQLQQPAPAVSGVQIPPPPNLLSSLQSFIQELHKTAGGMRWVDAKENPPTKKLDRVPVRFLYNSGDFCEVAWFDFQSGVWYDDNRNILDNVIYYLDESPATLDLSQVEAWLKGNWPGYVTT